MKPIFRIVLAIVAVISSATLSHAAKQVDALQIEVLLYSGRANPVFILSDNAEISAILALAGDLPQSKVIGGGVLDLHPLLGYSGLRIENLSSARSDIESFEVGRGAATLYTKGSGVLFAAGKQSDTVQLKIDNSRRLEHHVLDLLQRKNLLGSQERTLISQGK